MKNYSLWVLALILAGGAAGRLRSGWLHSNDGEQTITSHTEINKAAARDGAYLGKVAAQRGDARHMAVGRWATNADRALFVASYSQAYSQNEAGNDFFHNSVHNSANKSVNKSVAADGGRAAFRDGLYLGKLDIDGGNDRHLAVGRWSNDSDRLAFASGYNQANNNGELAGSQQRTIMRQASLGH